jgi:hypothetical protein
LIVPLGELLWGIVRSFIGKDIPNSALVIIGAITLFLILPWIKKLEVGPFKVELLETESKGAKIT